MGRIGRSTLAAIIESGRSDIEVVSINAPAPIETLVHLMKYDSVHGRFPGDIKIIGSNIDVGRGQIDMQSTYNPAECMAQLIRRAPPKNSIARFESARGCETSFAPPNHQRSLISIAFCRGLLCVLLASSPIVDAILRLPPPTISVH